ncbi:ABC transporter transmembrane domain-containing protein [Palleronia sp. LCG004]|uniref:ABC transporter transmembrane domain-containing protein n=1 Tax=Palleronia sp. LCG004 TaxID=3079304 RepID=UPI002942278B|nr:ABC transporter transmembrane domain-containing protein [Palleronia sp. LCG004]WOI57706.1 ATP-binding cassette domain-containing protein [Palleronia sp. LCG004]
MTADFAYDTLIEGMESGLFCGIPVAGSGPRILVEVLRRRAWPVNARSFAGATPHFPDRFEIPEIRATLRNLGLFTREVQYSGADLAALPPGTMILHRDRVLFVETLLGDGAVLRDCATGARSGIRAGRVYDCLIVEDRPSHEGAGQVEPLRREIVTRFWPELRLLVLLTTLSSSLIIAASMSVAFVFEAVLPSEAMDTLVAICIGLVGMMAIDIQLRRIRAQVTARVSGRLDYIVSAQLYSKLLRMPLSLLVAAPNSEQLERLKQFEAVRDFAAGPGMIIMLDLPFVAALIVAIFVINLQLGFVVLATLAVLAVIVAIAVPRLRSRVARHGTARRAYRRLLSDTLDHAGQIARRGLGPAFSARLQPAFKEELEAQAALDRTVAALGIGLSIVMTLSVAAIAFVGAWQVTEGNISGGALVACIILGSRLFGPVRQALLVLMRADGLLKIFRQVDAMRALPSERDDSAVRTDGRQTGSSQMPIAFENVVMRYPRSSEPALKNLTFEIPPNCLTCIAGPSGAGKTSLLRAIVGNHTIQSGRVRLGTMNLAQWAGRQKAELIGYVGHEPLLIHGTVAQNLRLIAPAATRTDLEAICDELGLLDKVRALPAGFDTVLDRAAEAAMTPTFRTQLCVARALLGMPKILLLDEIEVSLSPEDERLLMAALERRLDGMSCVLVSHRPTILARARHVVALRDGRVAFAGAPSTIEQRKP